MEKRNSVSGLPYTTSKSNFRNLFVVEVQDKSICLPLWSGFIIDSEVGTKINIKIWNLDSTGQNPLASVISES